MPTVRIWKPLAAWVVGSLLGAGFGWCWFGVAAYGSTTCDMRPDQICRLYGLVWYPIAVLIAAVVAYPITRAALGRRSYAASVAPSVTVLAAVAYHGVPAGKVLVAAGILGVGLAVAGLADRHRESRSGATSPRLGR
jgi:hypothetical protein